MRIFFAGATGVLGSQLTPLLVAAGHSVVGITRSPERVGLLEELGAEPMVCDVFDAAGLAAAVATAAPDLVMHQLTDLPDTVAELGAAAGAANARIRRDGTRNLLAAASAAGVGRIYAQSVAWPLDGDGGDAVADLERMIIAVSGVVLRYGRFYGPGTYHPHSLPEEPRVHIDRAAELTLAALATTSGLVTIVDDSHGDVQRRPDGSRPL